VRTPLIVKTDDGRRRVINEEQICTVDPYVLDNGDIASLIKMSNGDEFVCVNHSYESWEADVHLHRGSG